MKKNVIMFLLLLVMLCAVSHVSAAEDSDCLAFDNSTDIETQSIEEANDLKQDSVIEDAYNQEYASESGSSEDIKEKIDNAQAGDVINLSGNYNINFSIVINKDIEIVGIGDGATIKYNESMGLSTPLFFINSTVSKVVLRNLKFINGVSYQGGAIESIGNNVSIIDCEFINNAARGGNAIGGAVMMYGSNSRIINCTFDNNQAHQHGGAIVWNGVNGTIVNSKFRGNKATGDDGRGGALAILADDFNIINSTFENNHADRYGGAVYLNNTNCTVKNCNFADNDASGGEICWGGALLLLTNTCLVEDCNFTKNYADDCGGAIYADKTNNGIVNCKFTENYVTKEFASRQGGGAIFACCDGLNIDSDEFINNYANSSYGGAIACNVANTTVQNSFFKGNLAKKQGKYHIGSAVFVNRNITIKLNQFIMNFNETQLDTVYGIPKEVLDSSNNTFNKTKINSTVTFSAGMVFEYGRSGRIYVTVEGGIIELKNIEVLDHPEAKIDFSDNVLTVSGLAVGKYTLRVTTTADENHNNVSSDLSVTVNQATATIKASKVTVALKKGTVWQITIVDSKSGKGIANMELILKVYTGKKFKTVKIKTNSKGIASFKTSSLSKGSHTIIVNGNHPGYYLKTLKSTIKVVKPKKLTFRVTKKSYEDGSNVIFRVFLKGKAVNGIKLNLNIYNGKKIVKTIKLKSTTYKKKKGIVGYFTNKLSVGKHKVVLEPENVKYSGSKKSSIKITKKQTSYPASSSKISGK
jgi:predicted outer membrane repeat protein